MTLLTRSQLLSLMSTTHDQPVLSVYIDGTASDPSSHQWRIALSHAVENARDLADLDHAGRADFDRAVELLHERLAAHTAGLGAAGWVGFIGPRGVHYANTCSMRLPTIVRWGHGAFIAPYVRALAAAQPAILALIDARKVEIFEYAGRRLRRVEEIRAYHGNGQPTHLGQAAKAGFHVGTRGGTGRDRLQRALNEGTARMEREAAREITRRAQSEGMIMVAGTPQHRRNLLKMLEGSSEDGLLELETLDIHATPAQLAEAVENGCERLRRERIEREVMAVIEAAGSRGPAALGPETTSWALGQGRVQSLYLTPSFLDDHTLQAEQAVRAALAQQANIDVVSDGASHELDAHGGVAARLRYRLL